MNSFSSPRRGLRAASSLFLALTFGCDDSKDDPTDPVADGDPASLDGSQDGQPGDGSEGEPPDGSDGQPGDGGDGAPTDGEPADGEDESVDGDAGEPDAGAPDAGDPETVRTCSTTVPATENGFVQLCAVEEGVRHVRIEGLLAPQVHASTQVLFGLPSAPTMNQPTIGAGQFQALFYGGGFPAPSAMVVGNYAGHDVTWTEGADFQHTASTVCFDLSDGAVDKAPSYVLWVSGQKGADCDDASTLTLSTAFAHETSFESAVGTIDKTAPVFFRQAAAQEAVVTLRSEPVLSVDTTM